MTVTAEKINAEGKKEGSKDLEGSVFGVEPNQHLMHLAVRRELANARSGSANTKTRAEVRGGGRKPWRQKGTGRARAGSIRSPLFAGGGIIFGPKPRKYTLNMPKKMRAVAFRSVLSVAVSEGKLQVIDNFKFVTEPKTKLMNEFLTKQDLKGKSVLILADYRLEENGQLKLAARNLPEIKLRLPMNLSVKDILQADVVIATEQAIEEINERYGKNAGK